MIPHIPKIVTFSPEEINIIETELQQKNYPTHPTEIELCQMAQLIQQKHFRDATSLDVAVYLRQKLQNLQRPQIQQIPVVSENQGSIFKQFAEIKVEFPQKNNKDYVCKSKRKVRPSLPVESRNLEETVQIMDSNTAQCHSQFQKRGRKTGMGQAGLILNEGCTWAYHELFYSSLDKNYLQEDELMLKLLRELQMIPERLTYYEHRMIRRALPSPRKFTSQFVSQEVDRLNQIRAQLRNSPRQRGKQPEVGVGKQVIALHPVCGHLHSGSILAIYKENQFMVKFNRPELGTQKVLDILMAAKEVSSPHKVIVDNMDFDIMGLAIRLLQLKADLLKLMKQYNTKARELQARQEGLDNLFFQEYGWIGSTINILSLGIKHVISKFRVRGLNQSNQDRVGRHFSSILINPLALMEKQLQKSSEPSDIFASKQIKNIISTHRETRTEYFTKEIFTKQKVGITESQLQEQKKEIMDRALKAMIGILVSLRYESRNFSVEQNKYVTELMGSIDSSHAQYINEIYQVLHSITGKIGAEIK